MRFLCLAYGAERDWNALSPDRQAELLAQDEVLRRRGDTVGALGLVTTVRRPGASPETTGVPVMRPAIPLAGFSVVEARDLDEAILLVAGGAVEIRPILDV